MDTARIFRLTDTCSGVQRYRNDFRQSVIDGKEENTSGFDGHICASPEKLKHYGWRLIGLVGEGETVVINKFLIRPKSKHQLNVVQPPESFNYRHMRSLKVTGVCSGVSPFSFLDIRSAPLTRKSAASSCHQFFVFATHEELFGLARAVFYIVQSRDGARCR